jgi:hypothetical protein
MKKIPPTGVESCILPTQPREAFAEFCSSSSGIAATETASFGPNPGSEHPNWEAHMAIAGFIYRSKISGWGNVSGIDAANAGCRLLRW